jgi:hypothetical protein
LSSGPAWTWRLASTRRSLPDRSWLPALQYPSRPGSRVQGVQTKILGAAEVESARMVLVQNGASKSWVVRKLLKAGADDRTLTDDLPGTKRPNLANVVVEYTAVCSGFGAFWVVSGRHCAAVCAAILEVTFSEAHRRLCWQQCSCRVRSRQLLPQLCWTIPAKLAIEFSSSGDVRRLLTPGTRQRDRFFRQRNDSH